MEIISGKVADFNQQGELVIVCKYADVEKFISQKLGNSEVRVGISDGRKASAEQVRKAHALIGEIAEFTGNSNADVLLGMLTDKTSKERKSLVEDMKKCLKLKFVAMQMESLYNDIFSFSDVDMTTAREFISFCIDFITEWGIPTKRPLLEMCEDIDKYIYSCLKHKICAVCGRTADLHHIDRVGMGNNRKDIANEGMEALSLCRAHHTEAHIVSDIEFMNRYHLGSAKLDKKLCKIWEVK